MKRMTLLKWSPIALAVAGLAACGGGGGDTTSATTSTYTVTGTVPGTLIEAFCEDGSYHSVTSLNNGTTQHPFSLTLPSGVACQLVMTMNENDPATKVTTPVAMVTAQGKAIAVKATEGGITFDMGYVDLPSDPTQIDDADGDHVKDTPLEHAINALPQGVQIAATLGTPGSLPIDPDGDGVPNLYDPDDDNDGKRDDVDDDDDGDGVPDYMEKDSDHDGVDDDHDRDDDNDGRYDEDDPDYSNQINTMTLTPAPVTFTLPTEYTYDPTGGRLMAAQCAQCHGTNGYSVSSIEGLAGEADEVYEEIWEYHYKFNYEIMAAQAKIYELGEAREMQKYFEQMASMYGRIDGGDDDYDDDDDERDDD